MRYKFRIQNVFQTAFGRTKFKIAIQKLKFLKTFGFLLVLLTFTFYLLTYLFPIPYTLYPIHAQGCPATAYPRAGGLITTPSLGGIFNTSANSSTANGVCVINDAARLGNFAFGTGDIYNTLLSTYYDRARASASLQKILINGDSPPGSYNFNITTLVHITGNLTVSGNPTGTRTGVVFVDGNLIFNTSNYTYGNNLNDHGTLFVVRGNVIIDPAVTQIHAIILSTGNINTGNTSSQLQIFGSLISLNANSGQHILFQRDLGGASNQTTPAEIVRYQPKYLILLKDIFSQTDQKWSEIAGRVVALNPATPVPTPQAQTPTVVTNAATSVTVSSATLQGTANPNGFAATGWFRYYTSNPGSCSDSIGTRFPSSGGSNLGAGTTVQNYSQTPTLNSGTNYWYCAIASNTNGTTVASNPPIQFTTSTAPARRVFLTLASYTGNLGGLAGADANCQARATAGALSGTWRAWLSDDGSSAANRLTHNNGPYNRLDGARVANNWNELVSGALQNPINMTELGQVGSFEVWTGTNYSGNSITSANCNNWTDDSGSYGGYVGNSGATDSSWTTLSVPFCNATTRRLYCIEQ